MARILIIDDDSKVLGTYCKMLEHAGYEVLVASDGKKGISIFKENSPDLVITDIFMPEKDGLEIIGELKRDFPDVKIIAISGGGVGENLPPKDFLEYAKLFGAMCTLNKPIEKEDLLKAVQECLS